MTLTDFLLARIAEDEDRSRALVHRAQQHHLTLQDPSHLGKFIPGWGEWPEVKDAARRTVAECEAKRRIVALHEDAKHQYDEEHDIDGSVKYSDGAVWALLDKLEQWEVAIKLLALPYADHSDYRDEWRPA